MSGVSFSEPPSSKVQQDAPPHSVEAEKGVLSSILQWPSESIVECVGKITVNHFYVPAHRTVYEAFLDRWDAGEPIELITFTQVLRDKNLLASVGGAAFVTELQTSEPATGFIGYYIEILQEKYIRREAMLLGRAMARGAIEPRHALAQLEGITERNGSRDGLPAVEDVSQLISSEIVLPPDVIHGLLHKGGKMVLGGGSKSFKTWQLIDIATAVATGREYLGFATTKGRVLYINLEIQTGFFARRCKAVIDAKSVKIENGSFDVWNLRGHAAELSKLLPEMLRRAGADKYALIIVDPIYKVLGEHEENLTHHIAAIMNDLEKLAVRSGAAVVFGAHFSKGNQAAKDSIDRISGSGTFARDPDTILILTKHEVGDAYTVETTLRNHPPIEPFVVRWQFPLMVRDDTLDPMQLKKPGGRPPAVTHTQLVDLLAEKPLKAAQWQLKAKEELDVSPSDVLRQVKRVKR